MQLVLLDSKDDVATAPGDLTAGDVVDIGTRSVELLDHVPRGHKVALRPIPKGQDVIRYGEVIGSATADIAAGQHVHVHNLVSKRLPGGADR